MCLLIHKMSPGILTRVVYAGSVNREACMGQTPSQMEHESPWGIERAHKATGKKHGPASRSSNFMTQNAYSCMIFLLKTKYDTSKNFLVCQFVSSCASSLAGTVNSALPGRALGEELGTLRGRGKTPEQEATPLPATAIQDYPRSLLAAFSSPAQCSL